MTQVKFFYNPEHKETFAIFPNNKIRGIFGTILYTCYSAIGQHSGYFKFLNIKKYIKK